VTSRSSRHLEFNCACSWATDRKYRVEESGREQSSRFRNHRKFTLIDLPLFDRLSFADQVDFRQDLDEKRLVHSNRIREESRFLSTKRSS